MNTLFSTYTQGENRVTASILATFERLPFRLVEQILQQLLQEETEPWLQFKNQIKTGKKGTIPDACISASFSVWIETKIKGSTLTESQIKGHLEQMGTPAKENQFLLLLTPDKIEPDIIDSIEDNKKRIRWSNFQSLCDIIQELLDEAPDWATDLDQLPDERDRDILRELYHFIKEEGLIIEEQVLVIPARFAYPDYEKYGAYLCQENRSFRPASHLAFYRQKKIENQIPKIVKRYPSICLKEKKTYEHDGNREKLLLLADNLRINKDPRVDETYQIFLLEKGIELSDPIEHKKPNGIQKQRYFPLSKITKGLNKPKTTDDLWGKS
jgi:hypothetical protein